MVRFSNNMEGYRKKDEHNKYVRKVSLEIALTEENKKREESKKNVGPRGKFLEAIEQEDVTIEQAMEDTIEQMKVLLERDLINWMREELVKGRLSDKTMEKIKNYLEGLGQNSPRKSDDDAR